MKLALFFTEGVSLETWEQYGMLDREIKPYNYLANSFDKIYFITYGKFDEKYKNLLNPKIVILPQKWDIPPKLYSFLAPLAYYKELRGADLYKTNQMSGSWTALIAKLIFRKKLIIRCGYQWSLQMAGWNVGWLKKIIIHFIEFFAYRFSNSIIVTSDQAKKYIEKRYNISPAKINLVSNYVDTELFKPLEVRKNPASICFVGRFEKQKNLLLLVEALQGLDVRLVLIGSGSLKEEILNRAKKLQINVEFKGTLPNDQLPEELNKYEIFVLPSTYEGNPKVLLEAMACGMAVVGTNVIGINNIIKHKDNGYLCDPNVESLRNSVKELLANYSLVKELGTKARKYIVNECNLNIMLEKEKKIMEATYNHRRRSFSFGRNWRDYVDSYLTIERLEKAKESMAKLISLSEFKGKTLIDVGCGSGIFSYNALQLGCNEVISFDFDKNSVATSCLVKEKFGSNLPPGFQWKIFEGSILDKNLVSNFKNKGDIVYSWGVLHHTGDMFSAINNVADLVKPGGYLIIAIYNKAPSSKFWLAEKRFYNNSSWLAKIFINYFLFLVVLSGRLIKLLLGRLKPDETLLSRDRGMSIYYDVVDWAGGYPYEFASCDEIIGYLTKKGFVLVSTPTRLPTRPLKLLNRFTLSNTGCNEFVFKRPIGYMPKERVYTEKD